MSEFYTLHRSPTVRFFSFLRSPRRLEDLTLFTRHVAGAMTTRAPLPIILRAYASDAESGRLAKIVFGVADRVESGMDLSEAMEDYPLVFPAAYRRLVRLGEQGKTLGRVMAQLAETMERTLKMNEYFRRAAIYPFLVLSFLFLIVLFISTKILPKFIMIYQELGITFPIPNFVSHGFLLFRVIEILLLITIVFILSASLGLRVKFIDYGRLPLELPLIGHVLRVGEAARFADYLAILLDNRVPLAESLGLLADSSENSYVRSAMHDFHRRFQQGERLSDLIASQPLFPAGMAAIVAHSEDQGALAETLRALGDFYRERTSHGLQSLREIFGPLIIVSVGVTVAMVVMSIYLPLFYLPRAVG